MTVDYSRPVGWWCPVCFGVDRSGEAVPWCRYRRLDVRCMASLVPVYLPIPEGQRPLVEDEVDEAEVVTVNVGGIIDWLNSDGTRWTTDPTVEHINYIVTGATE